MNASIPQRPPSPILRNLLFIGLCLLSAVALTAALWRPAEVEAPQLSTVRANIPEDLASVVEEVDRAFREQWHASHVEPVAPASDLLIARRLSLALTGTVPSLEEIRALEKIPEADRLSWWLEHLFADRRSSDYLAERFARAYVGVETGPFLVYRRNRMVSWLSDEFFANRRYDELARELIAADGVWTTQPATNFITVTIDQNDSKRGPDEIKLAARVTRAFLGVRIDCVQCHDDKFGDRWKQEDFHQLAAFFSEAEVALGGVRDKDGVIYEARMKGEREAEVLTAKVPFAEDLYPANSEGTPRERLAAWVTHPENTAFARATVNRVWALMFNRPLIDAVDDLPLDGPFPAGMEILASDLVANDFDLRRLIRVITASKAFQLESRSPDPESPVSEMQKQQWASFPLTRMRPEQMAASITQSASLTAINADSHIIRRLASFGDRTNFVKRYGDLGEDEFSEAAGTIPQRLLMMNGKVVRERTGENPVLNATTRVGMLAPDDSTAIEVAFLTTLSRRPTDRELEHFSKRLKGTKGKSRSKEMEDLSWALLNSTEFSWNH